MSSRRACKQLCRWEFLIRKISQQGVILRKWESTIDCSREYRFSDICLELRPCRWFTFEIQSSHNVSCPFQRYTALPRRCNRFGNTQLFYHSINTYPLNQRNNKHISDGMQGAAISSASCSCSCSYSLQLQKAVHGYSDVMMPQVLFTAHTR